MFTTIYPSEKCFSYVYYGVHKETGHFYFGSRIGPVVYLSKNRPSHIDFGKYYKTSSKEIKTLGFENFNWVILAEFFISEDAFYFENQLIREHKNDPLLLNKYFCDDNCKKLWTMSGTKRKKESIEKQKITFHNKTEDEKRQAKEKRSLAYSGNANPMFGRNDQCYGLKKYSDEKRGKDDKTFFGEEKAKLMQEKRKITLENRTEEEKQKTKEKRSLAFSGDKNPMFGVDKNGDKNPMFGRRHSPETIEKIRKARQKSIQPK